MFHPDTHNLEMTYSWIQTIIEAVESSSMSWVWFWPNPDHGTNLTSKLIRVAREHGRLKNVKFLINVPPERFITLAIKAAVIIGNSSFGIREAAFIGLPAINLGARQKGRQRAANVLDLEEPNLEKLNIGVEMQSSMRYPQSNIYGNGSAGHNSATVISAWKPKIK